MLREAGTGKIGTDAIGLSRRIPPGPRRRRMLGGPDSRDVGCGELIENFQQRRVLALSRSK